MVSFIQALCATALVVAIGAHGWAMDEVCSSFTASAANFRCSGCTWDIKLASITGCDAPTTATLQSRCNGCASESVTSAAACGARCTASAGCGWFSYQAFSQTCLLHHTATCVAPVPIFGFVEYLMTNCQVPAPASTLPTDAPPTPVPTTEVPPTPVPTTEVPPTPAPTTEVPPTPVPTTEVPPTPVPTTEVPPTPVPTTEVPPTPAPTLPPTPVPGYQYAITVTGAINIDDFTAGNQQYFTGNLSSALGGSNVQIVSIDSGSVIVYVNILTMLSANAVQLSLAQLMVDKSAAFVKSFRPDVCALGVSGASQSTCGGVCLVSYGGCCLTSGVCSNGGCGENSLGDNDGGVCVLKASKDKSKSKSEKSKSKEEKSKAHDFALQGDSNSNSKSDSKSNSKSDSNSNSKKSCEEAECVKVNSACATSTCVGTINCKSGSCAGHTQDEYCLLNTEPVKYRVCTVKQ